MKKVIVILLAIVICFTFGACGENNADTPDEENNAINNNNSKWYLKKEEKTFLDVEGTGSFVKTAYEYNLNENLICEKTFKEINNEFVQTLSKDFNYDDEGMINSMRICDEKNEIQMVMFDKHYLDGYSICKGDFDGGELAYFYKEGVLFKFEATTGNKLIKREYYDENGNATRVEVEDWLVYEYKYDNGNLVELICSDANGDISYKSKYEYDGFLLLKEITEIENNVSETIYNSEKMDNNTYKCTATDGSYIIFVIDDFGNMISNSSYEKEGNLITKTECVWDKK